MSKARSSARYHLADFSKIEGVPCPCGIARRAFANVDAFPGTLHVTEIQEDADLHYHKRLTETYYFLDCKDDAQMQLDDEIISVRQGTSVVIPPGVRHRAIGEMKVLIVCIPAFDPNDEWIVSDQ